MRVLSSVKMPVNSAGRAQRLIAKTACSERANAVSGLNDSADHASVLTLSAEEAVQLSWQGAKADGQHSLWQTIKLS